jgi:hypothetical protein
MLVAPVPARFETPELPARPGELDPAIEDAVVPAAPNEPAAPGGIELGIDPEVSSALQPATPLNRTIPSAAPLDTTNARMTLSQTNVGTRRTLSQLRTDMQASARMAFESWQQMLDRGER